VFGGLSHLLNTSHGHLRHTFLIKHDRHAKKGVSVTFGPLLPHTSSLLHLPPFRHVADVLWDICNVSLSPSVVLVNKRFRTVKPIFDWLLTVHFLTITLTTPTYFSK